MTEIETSRTPESPAVAYQNAYNDGVAAAIHVIERGLFLDSQPPDAKWVREVIAAIKHELKLCTNTTTGPDIDFDELRSIYVTK